jgi:hypothetical protein
MTVCSKPLSDELDVSVVVYGGRLEELEEWSVPFPSATESMNSLFEPVVVGGELWERVLVA